MKKFTKEQQAEIDKAIQEASLAQDELTEAIGEFNQQKDDIVATLEAAVEKYNEKIQAIKDAYESVAEDARAYYDERSEKWQEGDAGTNYMEWIDQLEAVDLDEVELDIPEDIEMPDFPDLSEELAPTEPEG